MINGASLHGHFGGKLKAQHLQGNEIHSRNAKGAPLCAGVLPKRSRREAVRNQTGPPVRSPSPNPAQTRTHRQKMLYNETIQRVPAKDPASRPPVRMSSAYRVDPRRKTASAKARARDGGSVGSCAGYKTGICAATPVERDQHRFIHSKHWYATANQWQGIDHKLHSSEK